MIGELHCHTYLSRPRWFHRYLPSPFELIDKAKDLGLDFVAITDHDCQESFGIVEEYALKKGVVLIPAVEVTTQPTPVLRRRAHILALGVPDPIHSRRSVMETIDAIHAQQGLAIVAHPFCSKFAKVLYIGHQAGDYNFDGVEVFNSDELEVDNIKAKALSVVLGLTNYAGSDAHKLSNLGNALVKVDIPRTKNWRDLVKGMREGKVSLVQEKYNDRTLIERAKHFIFQKWPLPITP